MLSSPSGVSAVWECAPSLQNVSVVTPNDGVIEEQRQKNKHLQEQLAYFKCVQCRTFPANVSRGNNVLQRLKKVSLTPTDKINQQSVVGGPLAKKLYLGIKNCGKSHFFVQPSLPKILSTPAQALLWICFTIFLFVPILATRPCCQ
jgi:hypothetical protein